MRNNMVEKLYYCRTTLEATPHASIFEARFRSSYVHTHPI